MNFRPAFPSATAPPRRPVRANSPLEGAAGERVMIPLPPRGHQGSGGLGGEIHVISAGVIIINTNQNDMYEMDVEQNHRGVPPGSELSVGTMFRTNMGLFSLNS